MELSRKASRWYACICVLMCVCPQVQKENHVFLVFCVRVRGCIYQVSEVHGAKERNVQPWLSGCD